MAAWRAPVICGQAFWPTEFGGSIILVGQVSCGKAALSVAELFLGSGISPPALYLWSAETVTGDAGPQG